MLRTLLWPWSMHLKAPVRDSRLFCLVTIDGVADTYRAHNYIKITVVAMLYSNMAQPEGAPNRFTRRTCGLRSPLDGPSHQSPDAAKRHLANQSWLLKVLNGPCLNKQVQGAHQYSTIQLPLQCKLVQHTEYHDHSSLHHSLVRSAVTRPKQRSTGQHQRLSMMT